MSFWQEAIRSHAPHVRAPNISLYIRRFQLPLTSVTRHEDARIQMCNRGDVLYGDVLYYRFAIVIASHTFLAHLPTLPHPPAAGKRNVSHYTHSLLRPFLPLTLVMRHSDARVASRRVALPRACSLQPPTEPQPLSEGRSVGSILRGTRVHRARNTPFCRAESPVRKNRAIADERTNKKEDKEKEEKEKKARFNDARRCERNPFVGAMRREHPRDADFARAVPALAPVPADAAIAAAAATDPDPAADVAATATTALLHPLATTAAYLTASMKIPPLSWPRWVLEERSSLTIQLSAYPCPSRGDGFARSAIWRPSPARTDSRRQSREEIDFAYSGI